MRRIPVRMKSSAEMQKKFQSSKVPGWNILQGLFLVVIGVVFIVSNAAGSPHQASPVSNVGLDIGVILVVLGAVSAANSIFKLVRAFRQRRRQE